MVVKNDKGIMVGLLNEKELSEIQPKPDKKPAEKKKAAKKPKN